MEAAHRERTPWRPKRKEELKDRRWCRSDAEGDGSIGDGHHDAEFLLQALAARFCRDAAGSTRAVQYYE